MIRSAHRIAVIKNRQVIETGPHHTLIAKGGHYAALHDSYKKAGTHDLAEPTVAASAAMWS
jgi:ABC-type multidrug transport system fused ATPase/permease subunit